jgi:SAM-dependent methyltransferase
VSHADDFVNLALRESTTWILAAIPQSSSLRTDDKRCTNDLVSMQTKWWKRVLHVQIPYCWHVRSLRLGKVLDLGCGIGRNLSHLRRTATAVGVDHNPDSVAVARTRGLVAFTPEEFRDSPYAREASFDSLLLAHVAEHLGCELTSSLLREYLCYVKARGKVVLITPPQAGFRSDETHVEFVDFARAGTVLRTNGLEIVRQYSFPLPRYVGKLFKYNEFVTVAKRPAQTTNLAPGT